MRRHRTQHGGWLRAALAGSVLAVALSLIGTATAAAVPATFWGVDPQSAPTAEQDQRLARGGVDSIRIPVLWSAVQPSKSGALDWSTIDGVIGNAASADIEVLPFFFDAPKWAVPQVTINPGHVRTPSFLPVRTAAQKNGWTAFLQAAVARYGPEGTFWAAHPGIPNRPIRTWQIWNEENFKYFVAKPNPAEYAKLVELSSQALKAADPGAKVILGGLFSRPKEARWKRKPPVAYYASDFLDGMYGSSRTIRSKFDGVAVHPYTYNYQEVTPRIEEVRKALRANHDIGKGLWITELGWSSLPPSNGDRFSKGVGGQVTQLKGAFSLIKSHQVKWRLQRVFWFSVDDAPQNCNFCGGTGLFGPGFVPKPSWKAYVKFAGGTPN
jgi:hypothetical protein